MTTIQARPERSTAPPALRRRGPGRRNRPLTALLVLASLTVLAPLYVTVAMAFKTSEQSVDGNAFSLPSPFNADSFVQAWQLTRFPVAFGVSAGVAAIPVLLTVLLG